jgi:hypothetical protein
VPAGSTEAGTARAGGSQMTERTPKFGMLAACVAVVLVGGCRPVPAPAPPAPVDPPVAPPSTPQAARASASVQPTPSTAPAIDPLLMLRMQSENLLPTPGCAHCATGRGSHSAAASPDTELLGPAE